MIELTNDGKGLGFGIIGGRSTGVMVKTILPGGAAGQVNSLTCESEECSFPTKTISSSLNCSLGEGWRIFTLHLQGCKCVINVI